MIFGIRARLYCSQGVSQRVVMDVLGHSQIAVTMNIYGHVVPAMQHSAGNEIDAAPAEEEPADPPVGEEQEATASRPRGGR